MDKIGNEYPHHYPPTSLSLVLLPFYWAYSSLFSYLNRSYFSVTHSQTEIKSVVSGLKKTSSFKASVSDLWFDEDTHLSWCLFSILLIEEGLRWIIRLKLSTVQPYYNLSQAYTCSAQAQFLLPGHLKTPNRIEKWAKTCDAKKSTQSKQKQYISLDYWHHIHRTGSRWCTEIASIRRQQVTGAERIRHVDYLDPINTRT